MAIEIIHRLKWEKKILITLVLILSLLLSAMAVRYMVIPKLEYTIEQTANIPGNMDIPKRKKRNR